MFKTQAIILSLAVRAQAIGAKIAAMQAFNADRQEGQSNGYQEQQFWACEQELEDISKQILRLSDKLEDFAPLQITQVEDNGAYGIGR
jgi:hypothetical protein